MCWPKNQSIFFLLEDTPFVPPSDIRAQNAADAEEMEQWRRGNREGEWRETNHGQWCHMCLMMDDKINTAYVAVPCGHRVSCVQCAEIYPYSDLKLDMTKDHPISRLLAAHAQKKPHECQHCPFCNELIVYLQPLNV
jgi:hypothetical protein